MYPLASNTALARKCSLHIFSISIQKMAHSCFTVLLISLVNRYYAYDLSFRYRCHQMVMMTMTRTSSIGTWVYTDARRASLPLGQPHTLREGTGNLLMDALSRHHKLFVFACVVRVSNLCDLIMRTPWRTMIIGHS